MRIPALLLGAALLPAAVPAGAAAHELCVDTLPRSGGDCVDDADHNCVELGLPTPVLIVCVGTHSRSS